MRESQLCLNELEVYYSDHPLTTHGPTELELKLGAAEQKIAIGRYEDLMACADALSHVRQVRASLKYMMTHPILSDRPIDMNLWIKGIVDELDVSRIALRDAMWIAENAQGVDWARMDLDV